ncbi:glycoside hydrolase [Mesorhizobium sp. B4-1-3]|uniref:glycoside hydrolase n=1 Tax=Mesorhizobium sp. B4-1-3 TaxID=2589889 RepID=UPI00112A8949|nr:glycoside hydrolase [Mesorhizobium sp. B4-1-3]TPI11216.1 glycoside hydrolase [Mesorhizobium sp. B4-1-3]
MKDSLEIWGGVECSMVRLRDGIRDQLRATGHFDRAGDLSLIAETGIKTLRYPVLWELVEGDGSRDWRWPDARLDELRRLGVRPIAGLVHHGSGPKSTHVLDPDFPGLLAGYAGQVAERYPWLEMFTPVNEPLTTARISGLYGLWHPHGTCEATCFRLTVAQCRAIASAMKAIRRHIPAAQLVQTEDFGRVFSTPRLRYQADYENERRWLALDLLSGLVDDGHPFHRRLLEAGVEPRHLAELTADPCPPDIIGIDYYLTSDRMLDDDLRRYPEEQTGGNGIDAYVDIAAVRSEMRGHARLRFRLKEIWDRFRRPIAVTELHNGCTREEQLRWLIEGWQEAKAASDDGADIRAITAWSLFGATDWNSMLVHQKGYYESGAFDVRDASPRKTVIASAVSQLVKAGAFDHPALDRSGWWRTEPLPRNPVRTMLLAGFGRMASVIEECCHMRRLAVRPAPPHKIVQHLSQTNSWAAISVEEGDWSARGSRSAFIKLRCQFPGGALLDLHSSPAIGMVEAANAFLDLVVDGQTGRFRLLRAEPNNQYWIEAVEEEVSGTNYAV